MATFIDLLNYVKEKLVGQATRGSKFDNSVQISNVCLDFFKENDILGVFFTNNTQYNERENYVGIAIRQEYYSEYLMSLRYKLKKGKHLHHKFYYWEGRENEWVYDDIVLSDEKLLSKDIKETIDETIKRLNHRVEENKIKEQKVKDGASKIIDYCVENIEYEYFTRTIEYLYNHRYSCIDMRDKRIKKGDE